MFSDRVRGTNAGPMLSKNVQQFEDDISFQQQGDDTDTGEAENPVEVISLEAKSEIAR